MSDLFRNLAEQVLQTADVVKPLLPARFGPATDIVPRLDYPSTEQDKPRGENQALGPEVDAADGFPSEVARTQPAGPRLPESFVQHAGMPTDGAVPSLRQMRAALSRSAGDTVDLSVAPMRVDDPNDVGGQIEDSPTAVSTANPLAIQTESSVSHAERSEPGTPQAAGVQGSSATQSEAAASDDAAATTHRQATAQTSRASSSEPGVEIDHASISQARGHKTHEQPDDVAVQETPEGRSAQGSDELLHRYAEHADSPAESGGLSSSGREAHHLKATGATRAASIEADAFAPEPPQVGQSASEPVQRVQAVPSVPLRASAQQDDVDASSSLVQTDSDQQAVQAQSTARRLDDVQPQRMEQNVNPARPFDPSSSSESAAEVLPDQVRPHAGSLPAATPDIQMSETDASSDLQGSLAQQDDVDASSSSVRPDAGQATAHAQPVHAQPPVQRPDDVQPQRMEQNVNPARPFDPSSSSESAAEVLPDQVRPHADSRSTETPDIQRSATTDAIAGTASGVVPASQPHEHYTPQTPTASDRLGERSAANEPPSGRAKTSGDSSPPNMLGTTANARNRRHADPNTGTEVQNETGQARVSQPDPVPPARPDARPAQHEDAGVGLYQIAQPLPESHLPNRSASLSRPDPGMPANSSEPGIHSERSRSSPQEVGRTVGTAAPVRPATSPADPAFRTFGAESRHDLSAIQATPGQDPSNIADGTIRSPDRSLASDMNVMPAGGADPERAVPNTIGNTVSTSSTSLSTSSTLSLSERRGPEKNGDHPRSAEGASSSAKIAKQEDSSVPTVETQPKAVPALQPDHRAAVAAEGVACAAATVSDTEDASPSGSVSSAGPNSALRPSMSEGRARQPAVSEPPPVPTIRVAIGRVEVRTRTPEKPAQPARRRPVVPAVSLDAYLNSGQAQSS